jgi:hypothetical protein
MRGRHQSGGELMKARWVMATCMTVLFACAGSVVLAQDGAQDRAPNRPAPDRNDQKLSQNRKYHDHIKFDDHDREVIRDWYNPDRDKILVGLRDPNRVSPYVDSRLQIGSEHDADLPIQRPALIEFWYRLTSSLRNYQYVAIRGHVTAIDDDYQDINDFIHFKLYF